MGRERSVGADSRAGVAGTAPQELRSRSLAVGWPAALSGVWARTHVRWLVGILVVALVLRVLWVATVQPDPRDGRFDDTVWYYQTSRLLAEGEGYVNYAERTPTALWAPGYPLILASLFRLPGDEVAAARGLNVVAGLALVAGVYYLGSRLWDRRAGLLAAGIMALFPSHIFFSSLVLTETLFSAMLVGLLGLALAWTLGREASRWRVFLLGIAAAAAAMVRPEGALVAVVIVAAWLAVHRSWRRVGAYTGLLILGMAVLFVPWTIRNAIQLGSPIVGTTGMGQVLIQAHSPVAGGRDDLYAVAQLWNRFEDVPQPEREIRVNNTGIRESVTYAVQHIPRELSLVPHRLAWFFRDDDSVLFWVQNAAEGETRELSEAWEDRWGNVANVYYYGVAAAMVLGLPFWLRRMQRRHVLIWAPFAVYSAMWAFLFVGEARYHFPLLPIFALLAAIGLSAFWQRWAPRREAPADE